MLRGARLHARFARVTERASIPPLSTSQLATLGLFGGLNEACLAALAESLSAENITIGTNVVVEGAVDPEMFVILNGELEVLRRGRAGDVRVAVLGPGDWFGEMTILDVQPRSATVRAISQATLLRITAEDVDRLLYRRDLRSYAIFVTNLARELSRRLRVADGILAHTFVALTDSYVRR